MPHLIACDVLVVGSGPAGSTAARLLAAAGVHVVVLEKHELPRYKTCGGGVVRRALRLAGVDLERVIERRYDSAELNFGSPRQRFVVQAPEAVLFMTMRARFDSHLLSLAQSAGARVLSPCRFFSMQMQREQVVVRTDQGSVAARIVIGADGVLSRVARAGNFQALSRRIPALECEVLVEDSQLRSLQRSVRFDFDIVPGGYAWLFPKGHHLSLGVLQTRPDRRPLHESLEVYMKHLGLEHVRGIEKHGALIPVGVRPGPMMRERALLVGDAAGLTDPVTCEGISLAIWSAGLAAKALLEAELRPEDAAALYHRSLHREILPELKLARGLARLLYGPRSLRNRLFDGMGQPLCDAMLQVIAGEKTYRELLTSPMNYLKLLQRAMGFSRFR